MIKIRTQKPYDGRSEWGWRFAPRVDSRRIRRASYFIIACFFLNPVMVLSLREETVEYPLKLAFLYNFTKFVEWPTGSYREPGAPLAICIVGDDPFSPDLEGELRTRSVDGHPVEVRTLRAKDALSVCHIVFVPVTEKNQAPRIVSGLKGSSTLTVGESEGFAVLGGIINLTVEDNKLHFEVNTLAAERAGLKISSKLLSMAKIVQEKEQDHGRKN
jgi:hypothetical protein